LEVTHGLRMEGASIARSTVLPLPDNSASISYCGIASFREKATRFLTPDQCSQLGYVQDPSMVLSVYTMTNKGDLYSSILLECSDLEFSRSVVAPNVPGSKVLLLPLMKEKQPTFIRNSKIGGYTLQLRLGDGTNLTSSKITNICMEKRTDCDTFQTIPLKEIQKRMMSNAEQNIHYTTWPSKNSRLSSDIISNDSTDFQEAMDSFPNLLKDDSFDTVTEAAKSNVNDLSTIGARFWRI
jgi:hypothetical protein